MKHQVFFTALVMAWLSCISAFAQDSFAFQEDLSRHIFDQCSDGGFYTNSSGKKVNISSDNFKEAVWDSWSTGKTSLKIGFKDGSGAYFSCSPSASQSKAGSEANFMRKFITVTHTFTAYDGAYETIEGGKTKKLYQKCYAEICYTEIDDNPESVLFTVKRSRSENPFFSVKLAYPFPGAEELGGSDASSVFKKMDEALMKP